MKTCPPCSQKPKKTRNDVKNAQNCHKDQARETPTHHKKHPTIYSTWQNNLLAPTPSLLVWGLLLCCFNCVVLLTIETHKWCETFTEQHNHSVERVKLQNCSAATNTQTNIVDMQTSTISHLHINTGVQHQRAQKQNGELKQQPPINIKQ